MRTEEEKPACSEPQEHVSAVPQTAGTIQQHLQKIIIHCTGQLFPFYKKSSYFLTRFPYPEKIGPLVRNSTRATSAHSYTSGLLTDTNFSKWSSLLGLLSRKTGFTEISSLLWRVRWLSGWYHLILSFHVSTKPYNHCQIPVNMKISERNPE